MPQPLSRVHPNAGGYIGAIPDLSFAHRPELGLLAMQSISSWSLVEERKLRLFLTLLGGPNDNGAIAYLSITNIQARNHMIDRIAAERLSNERYSLLKAIQKLASSKIKERDKLAHWLWGYSDAVPDGLLLANPRVTVPLMYVDVDQTSKQGFTAFHDKRNTLSNHILVYKNHDFINIVNDAEQLCSYLHRLDFILRDHPANRQNALYDALCAEPDIAKSL